MNSQSPPKGVTVPYTPIKALNVGGGVRLSDIMMSMDERVMLVAITMMTGTMYMTPLMKIMLMTMVTMMMSMIKMMKKTMTTMPLSGSYFAGLLPRQLTSSCSSQSNHCAAPGRTKDKM